MFKGLFMKNLTSGSWVGHPQAGTKDLCGYMTHPVTCTVFDSSKVFPPKEKENPLKAVLEVSPPGSKCCSHPPFPHRIFSLEKESHKLLSFQAEGREYQNHLDFRQRKVSLYFVLHVTGRARLKCCCWNAKMQSRTTQTKEGFAGFSANLSQNWDKFWNQVKNLRRLKVRDFQVKSERFHNLWEDAEE